MIISCSRRTDIPAFYTDWLFNRLKAGFVCVRNPRNPRNPHRISSLKLTPELVDGIVFWTKNPAPMLDRLRELKDYMYYFQYTITPYGRDMEPGLPDKIEVMRTFQRLAERIGPDRVTWRYDPIVINPAFTAETHLRAFEEMARTFSGFTHRAVISFLDTDYVNVRRNARSLQARAQTGEDMLELAGKLAQVAAGCGMEISACAETLDFASRGVVPARCIDAKLLERLLGCRLNVPKDTNQRSACGCAESIDIGMYNTCAHGCRYCYANYNAGEINANRHKHSPASPLLIGEIGPEDTVSERALRSCRDGQCRFKEW